LQGYKYNYVSPKKINNILDNIIAKYPPDRQDAVRQDFQEKLQIFKEKIEDNFILEEVIHEIVSATSKNERDDIRKFLENAVTPRNKFREGYEDIIKFMENENITPKAVDNYIKKIIRKLPKQFQNSFEEFVNQQIHIPIDLLTDNNKFQERRYEGRLQMEQYLKKAGLMGSLVHHVS